MTASAGCPLGRWRAMTMKPYFNGAWQSKIRDTSQSVDITIVWGLTNIKDVENGYKFGWVYYIVN